MTAAWKHPVDWALGPVFSKELRVTSRRRRHYALRFAYLAALMLFIGLFWVAADIDRHSNVIEMARAGTKIIGGIVWFQFAAMQVLALVLCSGAISGEIRQRTLASLVTTPISPMRIVTGKLFGSLLPLMVLLLISLPLLTLVRVLGGVPWMFLVSSFCVTVTAMFLVGALSVRFSVTSNDPLKGMFKALVLYAILFLAPLYVNSPIQAIYVLQRRMSGGLGWGASVNALWMFHCLLMAVAAMLLLRRSATLLKNVSLDGPGQTLRTGAAVVALPVTIAPPGAIPPLPTDAPNARRPSLTAASRDGSQGWSPPDGLRLSITARMLPDEDRPIRRVTGSPMVWKELRFFTSGNRQRTALAVLAVAALMTIIYVSLICQGVFNDLHPVYLWIYFIIGIAVTSTLAPWCIASEKQSQALLALLTTPMSDWHIALCKALGVFKRALAVWLLALGHVVLCVAMGCMTAVMAVSVLVLLAYLTVFLIGMGLYFSSRFHTPSWALICSLMAIAFLWILLPLMPIDFLLDRYAAGHGLFHMGGLLRDCNPFSQMSRMFPMEFFGQHGDGAAILGSVCGWAVVYSAAGALLFWCAKARLRKDLF